jgi:hypothetical protein
MAQHDATLLLVIPPHDADVCEPIVPRFFGVHELLQADIAGDIASALAP